MLKPRWLQALHRLGLELWLPLPLLGLLFWIGGGFVADRVLNRAYSTGAQLQVEPQPKVQRSVTVLSSVPVSSIEIVVKKHRGFSQVKVNPTDSALKQLTFAFPVTKLNQVEAAIAQELGLSPEIVRRSVHYQVQD